MGLRLSGSDRLRICYHMCGFYEILCALHTPLNALVIAVVITLVNALMNTLVNTIVNTPVNTLVNVQGNT